MYSWFDRSRAVLSSEVAVPQSCQSNNSKGLHRKGAWETHPGSMVDNKQLDFLDVLLQIKCIICKVFRDNIHNGALKLLSHVRNIVFSDHSQLIVG